MPFMDGNGVRWLVSLIKNYIGIPWSMTGDTNDTFIPDTADLDDYTTIGNYYSRPDSSTASNVKNNPSGVSFIMKVYSGAGRSTETSNGNYLTQHLEDLYGIIWIRYKTTGSWSAWKKIVSVANGTTGSGTNPIYVVDGVPTASTSTVGSGTKPVYLSSGTITASSSTVGSGTKPAYLSSGTVTASSSTVGGTAKPVYLSSGTITALTGTAGSGTKPVYLSSGTITASSSTVGSSRYPVYLNSGVITQCAYSVNCPTDTDRDTDNDRDNDGGY